MSAMQPFGRIDVPTNNPCKCQRCGKTHRKDGRLADIHWSIRCQRWLCLWCHFEAPNA